MQQNWKILSCSKVATSNVCTKPRQVLGELTRIYLKFQEVITKYPTNQSKIILETQTAYCASTQCIWQSLKEKQHTL